MTIIKRSDLEKNIFFVYNMTMTQVIGKNIGRIHELCRKHQVKTLYTFGSVQTDRFNRQSDIDFLISFQDVPLIDFADNFFDLQISLEQLLKRRVDLVVEKAISNPYLKNIIERTRTLIYG